MPIEPMLTGLLGISMVVYGIRGFQSRRVKLSPPRGIPYREGERILEGRRAERFSLQAIAAGCVLVLRCVWYWMHSP